MAPIDALIPLAIGLLLVLRPQSFVKQSGSPEDIAKKSRTLRTIGYVLVAVAALYVALVVLRSRVNAA
jgi:hypothetical protein